jgi:hypothetical protein
LQAQPKILKLFSEYYKSTNQNENFPKKPMFRDYLNLEGRSSRLKAKQSYVDYKYFGISVHEINTFNAIVKRKLKP